MALKRLGVFPAAMPRPLRANAARRGDGLDAALLNDIRRAFQRVPEADPFVVINGDPFAFTFHSDHEHAVRAFWHRSPDCPECGRSLGAPGETVWGLELDVWGTPVTVRCIGASCDARLEVLPKQQSDTARLFRPRGGQLDADHAVVQLERRCG